MSTYTYGESLWLKTSPKAPVFESLSSGVHTDVVIIGGGLTGLHTALALAEAGKKVTLLEKDTIASAASGGALAKVTASHAYLYSHIYKKYGSEGVRIYAQSNDVGYRRIQELISAYHITCDFEHSANYLQAAKKKRISRLLEEYEALKAGGLAVEWTQGLNDRSSVYPAVYGSVKTPGQASYNPRKFALGLVNAFTSLGGLIYEHTPVTHVTENPKTNICMVKTQDDITLTCDYVVVATRVPDLLSKRFHRGYANWTAAIYAFEVDAIKYKDTYFRLSRRITSYRPNTDAHTGKKYVLLEGVAPGTFKKRLSFSEKPAAAWRCSDTETIDYLPTIGRWCNIRRHLYCALGYNGWGMTNSAAAGLILAQEIADDTRFAKALGDERLARAAVRLLTPLNKKRNISQTDAEE